MAESVLKSTFEVRFKIHPSNTNYILNLCSLTSVKKVKSILCSKHELNNEDCEIIFCGQKMKNDSQLRDYNLGPSTVLHVITLPKMSDQEKQGRMFARMSHLRNSFLTGIWLHRRYSYFPFQRCPSFSTTNVDVSCTKPGNLMSFHPQFFVYCKSTCFEVRPGKLRVRCASCKNDSVVLIKEPSSWKDILGSGNVHCNCFSEDCEGSRNPVEFYFKCSSCQSSDISDHDTVIPLQDVHSNVNNAACMTCFDICNPVVMFPCKDDHVICLLCFEQYSRNKLQERQLTLSKSHGFTISCPEKCQGSLLADTHIFHILGNEEYRTYQAFAAEECLLQDMQGLVCPSHTCGAGLFFDNPKAISNKKKITCASCGYMFCFNCRQAYHGIGSCTAFTYDETPRNKEVRNYMETIKTIKQISKRCPNCEVPTERDGGCMHMTCAKCKFEWCWSCCKNWNYECQSDHWFM